jgi:transcriptional regulator with XRE-family HTH domain
MEALAQAECKAARALLNWTAAQLSKASSVPIDTVRSFESGRSKTLSRENEGLVRKALEMGGIQFLEAGAVAVGPGVALSESVPR